MGTIRGILTAVLFVLFLGIVFWAYSRKRRKAFDEAARLPLEDQESRGDSDRGKGTEGDNRQ